MRVTILATVLLLGGCGGLSYQVDRDLLLEVSVENKLLLFEAENEVSIAIDELEQISRQIQKVKQQISSVNSQRNAAEADYERADSKEDEKAMQIAKTSADILELKKDFLEARVSLFEEKLKAQDGLVRVAFAKYELAKAKLVKKNNVRGADKIDLADYEAQVDEVVAVAREEQQAINETEKEVETLRKQWLDSRNQLEQTSGGGAASPWADDAMAWGEP
ncbi:MAG: hypothetical protein JW841_08345 [Deltaproteobacteria bacterium]|nr:hypothetical protein [Deltaproteobacteria bacterium]